MRSIIEMDTTSSLRDVRDLAIFDTRCDLLARRSEIEQMLGRDIDLSAGTIRIAYSNPDQAGRGSIFTISPRTVVSIKAWLGASGLRDIVIENAGTLPVFVGIMNDGKSVWVIMVDPIQWTEEPWRALISAMRCYKEFPVSPVTACVDQWLAPSTRLMCLRKKSSERVAGVLWIRCASMSAWRHPSRVP